MFGVFDDRWNAAKLGWKSLVSPPPRKDFALFIRLEIIGSSKGFVEEDQKKAQGDLDFIPFFFNIYIFFSKLHKNAQRVKRYKKIISRRVPKTKQNHPNKQNEKSSHFNISCVLIFFKKVAVTFISDFVCEK